MPLVSVQADLYPATVYKPNGTVVEHTKVILGLECLWIYEGGNRGIVLNEQIPLLDLRGNQRTGYVADTDDGEVVIVKGKGCGCGSPLRSYRPFDYHVVMQSLRPR